jgi:sugar/nucleoside kinase (ribokinase family)
MKVLGIGESVIDMTYVFENGIPADLIPDTKSEKHVGGPVLSAMILLSRLGVDCTFVSTIGRDDNAIIIKKLLKHESIQLIPKYQRRTKVNKILVDARNGSRKKVRGNITHPDIKHLDRKFIQQFDLIIFDRHEHTAFYEVIDKKRKDTKIIIDPSTEVSQFTIDMVKYADYPIIPIDSLKKINTQNNLDACLKKLYELCGKTIIITAGELGSLLYSGTEVEIIPAISVQAVDVNGAGDIFRGGFAYGVIQGLSVAESAAFGNLVASLKCLKKGNAAAIPTVKEIKQFKKKLTEKKQTTKKEIQELFFSIL